MEIQKLPITSVQTHEDNPRTIRTDKFKKLKKSIEEFPEMLKLRPLVVDENLTVLGGNMRLRAAQELKMTEIYVIQVPDLTEEQKKEFIIKDNVSFGQWDWDKLANEWQNDALRDWGMDVWNDEDEFDVEEETKEKEIKEKPSLRDDGYSLYELVMLHENKLLLQRTLQQVKTENNIEKQEDALMFIINNFNN